MEGIEILRNRSRAAHKGDFGHLLVVAGSPGLTGAAGLAALSSLKAGCGLVTLATGKSSYSILASKFTEVMFRPLLEKGGALSAENFSLIKSFSEKADGCLIGPGLGRKDATERLVAKLLTGIKKPIILDADGLNAISGKTGILKKAKAPVIVTPHPGEMFRLTGKTVPEIQRDRKKSALEFSREYNVITVLKGYQTVVASPDGKIYINFTGNAGLATAGSGDVLAGIVGGLMVQGLPVFSAATLGVYLHGLAGDFAARDKGEASMVATDVMEKIPEAITFLLEQSR